MPNTREIQRRIRSIDSTRQITRAMEMIAATKMRKARRAVEGSRAYAERMEEIFRMVAGSAERLDQPLLEVRPVKRIGVVMFASDRGLCGGMNTNVIRRAESELRDAAGSKPVSFITLGRKGEQAARGRGHEIAESFMDFADTPEYPEIQVPARLVRDEFMAGRFDEIWLAYPKFVSTLKNEPTFVKLLPATVGDAAEPATDQAKALTLFEPSPEAVLESLLPRVIEVRLWQALLDTKASEWSSRMVAMRNATNNAGDLLDEVKLAYNRARQAAITTEIAEIASAAELATK